MFHPSNFLNLSNKAYDVIKWIVTVFVQAFITLYMTLAQIWNWQDPEKVVLSVSAVAVFLGVLINLSSKKYGKEVDALFQGGHGGNA